MTDVSGFLKGAADRHTVTVLLSPDPDAVTAAEVAARAASNVEGSLADGPVSQDDVEQVKAQARQSAWAFDVGSVGRRLWEALAAQHRPTGVQQKAAKDEGTRLRWNPETFPIAAVAAALRRATNPAGDVLEFGASVLDGDGVPQIDAGAVELAQAVWDTFPLGETERLWSAVAGANSARHADRVASFG